MLRDHVVPRGTQGHPADAGVREPLDRLLGRGGPRGNEAT